MTVEKIIIKTMKKDITNLMRKNIKNLKGYSCAKDEFVGNAAIYLDANENPFPNTGLVLADQTLFNRYPDPTQTELRTKISEFRSIDFENIICGNGSDELIDQLIRIFCEPEQDSILICPPTFGMYEVCGNLNETEVEKIPLIEKSPLLKGDLGGFTLDVEKIIKSDAKILFIPNPAAPTGGLFEREQILEILDKFQGVVVIDEAYVDFASVEPEREVSFIKELKNYQNLVVLQTFSKFWGLAGARVGICFANEKIIDRIIAIKMPYSLNIYSQKLATKALDNYTYWKSRAILLVKERKTMELYFSGKNFVKTIFRSDANFLYMKVKDAQKCMEVCLKSGVVIRRFGDEFIRISVGLPEENQKVMSVLKQC